MWQRKDLLGLEDLSREEIEFILDTAVSFKEVSVRTIKKVPALRGKTIVNFFCEPSTRTRMSFELAAKRLSADMVNVASGSSSITKGESLKDTAKNIEAMKVDVIIIRHSMPGSAHLLAESVSPGVINAGDGPHEHPTQGLLDMFTIRGRKGRIEGLNVLIVGDIMHSRVARSNIWGLIKLGAKVTVVGPPTLIPVDIEKMGVDVSYDLDSEIPKADVINILRIQNERMERNFFPSTREYIKLFGIHHDRLKRARKDVLIMHPGPANRGIEIDPSVADGPYSVILDQVTNGIAVRMAVLYLIAGKETQELKARKRKQDRKK